MENKETVCAVVVTYNRKQLLLECLNALCKQTRAVDAIYIIDNFSNDGTAELLLENGYINELPQENGVEPLEMEILPVDKPKIYYVRMYENTGGAGGFHEGVKRAYERGFDWLWLMDDDVEPVANALETMMQYKEISECIHPSKQFLNGDRFFWEGHLSKNTGLVKFKKTDFQDNSDFVYVNYGCFEGMLIARRIVGQIGYPKKEFFFIGDDTLYGYQASFFTKPIYLNKICLIKKIDKRGAIPSKLADYLGARNIFVVINQVTNRSFFANFMYFLLVTKTILSRLLKYKRIDLAYAVAFGYIDGLLCRYGNEKRYLQ